MRLHFQERTWDLYLLVSYTVSVAASILALGIGNLLAIILVLFAPGYALVAALFPNERQLDWINRLVLSFGLSIAVVPLLGLTLNFTSFGLRAPAVVTTIALFTVLVSAGAWWRRMRLPAKDRLSATISLALPAWKEYSPRDRILAMVLAVCMIAAAGTVSYVVVAPRPREPVTEFYLLGPSGSASGYPTNLTVSQLGSVIIGIANHEAASVDYTVRIDLVGVRIVYNATSGSNETAEVNRTSWSTFNVILADGQNWTRPYTFQINFTGIWKIQFLLFKDGNLASPYRELHLFARVR